ncbi:MAG: von Willebrand factor, type [Acidobacteria bacterium]|jgi:VWFA-related protein|nr:von Willebrand factor, type [Acidobacteriota bacterium]
MRDHSRAGELRAGEKPAFASLLLVLLFLLIMPPSGGQPQKCPMSPSSQAGQFTIAVKVSMVVLHATVLDSKGTPVSGLDKTNFQLLEDGVAQQIDSFSQEDIPVTVGLVVDNSGSMGPKRPEVIAAALAFARTSNPQDQMFVVNFNERVSFGLPYNTPFTDEAAQLRVAMSSIAADGMTALYDAVASALEHLKKGNRDKKVLIVISDGGDNASKQKLAQIMAMARQSDAIIYTIGLFDEFDPDRNPGALKELAKTTGGEAFLPGSVRDVVPICERIAHDIRNQYTIAYIPANGKQDGTYRVIQVKAVAPGRGRLAVRTRAGYYAPRNSQLLPLAGATYHENPN